MARHRYARLALFPILAPIFLIGWVLVVVGARKPAGKNAERKVDKVVGEVNLEMGVIVKDYPELGPIEVKQKRLDD